MRGWRERLRTSHSSGTRTTSFCHCKSAEEARALWSAIADRFAACKLVLHPEKTTDSGAQCIPAAVSCIYTYVFITGGIGSTHLSYTADCVAKGTAIRARHPA